MPFDSGGLFSLVPSYKATAGQTIRTENHNPPLEDIANALSAVLKRDGRDGMVGALNMGSFPITNVATSQTATDAATVGQVQNAMPVGAVIDFAGSTAPATWLLCFGQAISRTTYAALFAAIGTTYGAGDGSTTFNVPDGRDVVVIGRGNMGGTARGLLSKFASTVLGSLFGVQEHALTAAQGPIHSHSAGGLLMPSHDHPITLPARVRAVSGGTDETRLSFGNTDGVAGILNITSGLSGTSPIIGTTANSTGGQAHPNVQPSLVMNKIIKASYA